MRIALDRSPSAQPIAIVTVGLLVAVVCNAGYCALHGLLSDAPVGSHVAWVWAAKATGGWWIAAIALAWLVASGPLAAPEPRAARTWAVAIGVVLPPFLVTAEWLLGRVAFGLGGLPETAGLGWLAYQRAPLVLAASAVVAWLVASGRIPRSLAARATRRVGPEAIEVLSGTGRTTVRLQDVERFESYQNYARVGLADGRCYLQRTTMARLERELPPDFVRVHRQTIVRRDSVTEQRSGSVLVLKSGASVRISRRYRHRL